jgi:hypothetical protein
VVWNAEMRENELQSTTLHFMDVVIWAHVHNGHVKARAQNSDVNARRSFATTVSQLKISDFSGETFKGFEVL